MLYSFRRIGTENDIIELSMPMSEREVYLKNNPDMEQIIVRAPGLADPIMLGRLNQAGKDFQRNVIDRMQASIPGNMLHTSKIARNIREI